MTNLKQLLPSAGSLVAEVEQDMKQHFNKHSMKKKNPFRLLLSSLGCHYLLSVICHQVSQDRYSLNFIINILFTHFTFSASLVFANREQNLNGHGLLFVLCLCLQNM